MGEALLIREVEEAEIPLVKQLFRENLWLLDRLFFTSTFTSIMKEREGGGGTSFLAMMDGQVAGTVSVRVVRIQGEQHGLIDSLVTAKGVQGRGIARKLLDAAISWLEEGGCRHIYAMVDRYNSRSWNMFVHHGFSPFDIPAQLRRFGTGFLRVWTTDSHFLGIGMYFLRKEQPGEGIGESSSLYNHSVGFAGFLIPWLLFALWGGFAVAVFPYLALLALISFIGHEYSHALIARFFGLKTYFRENMPGSIFYLGISLLRGIYPFSGSTYIRQTDWSYASPENARVNGLIYFIGPVASSMLALVFHHLAGITEGYWQAAFSFGVLFNVAIAVVNLLPLRVAGGFPFDGTKIYGWNKGAWALAVAIVGVSVYLVYFV